MGKRSNDDNVTVTSKPDGGAVGAIISNVTGANTYGSTATDNTTGKSADGGGNTRAEADANAVSNLKGK